MSYIFICFIILNFSGLLRFAKCEQRSSSDGSHREPSTVLDLGRIHLISSLLKRLAPVKVTGEGGWVPSALLALTGLRSEKFKDYALSGFISVVHMIVQVLAKDAHVGRRQKARADDTPFRFLFSLPQVVGLLSQMQDPNIVDNLLTEVQERMEKRPTEEAECVQLLLCKVTPFVRGMQRSLGFFARRVRGSERQGENPSCRRADPEKTDCPGDRERNVATTEEDLWEKTHVEDRIYFFAPTLNELIKFGDECDRRFPRCSY